MKTNLKKITIVAAFIWAVAIATHAQPITLTGTNYFQNFNDFGNSGLPGEWFLYQNATASTLGTLITAVKGGSTNGWADTGGGFKNYASVTNAGSGTNFLGTETVAVQNTDAERCLGVRPVSATDAGNAFTIKIVNTAGFGKFKLDLDMMLLNPQGRSNNWTVDFGISPDGSSAPTSFTVVSNNFYGASTLASAFGAYHRTIDFGSLLDNQPGPIWIRVVNLSASIGAGSRPTVGIDNFNLGFTNVAAAATKPVITTAPQSTTAYVGESVSLNVANSGTAPFTYQWYKNDFSTPVGNGTATLTLSPVTVGDAGNYYVIIANAVGSATNNPAAVITVANRVPIPTTIFKLRTNQDVVNWSPNDTTNFYTVTGVVITRTNMTTAANASFYIEDTNSLCGIDVFIGGDTTTRPAYGDTVQVTGPLSQFNGVLEFNLSSSNPTHIVNNLGPSGYTVPPKAMPLTAPSSPGLMETNYEGSLIVVANVTIPGGGVSNFVSGATLTVTNQSNQTFTLFIDARLGDIIGQPIPAGTATITGYVSQFKSAAPFTNGYQLVPTYSGAIVVSAPVVNPIPISIQTTGGQLVMAWTNGVFSLQSSTNVDGPYVDVSGASSPYTNTSSSSQMFFRLHYLAP